LYCRAISKTFSPDGADAESTDILGTLKNEHEELKDLLAALSDAVTAAQRRGLVQKIKAALVPHAKAEEKESGPFRVLRGHANGIGSGS
jgi:hypothetical protein